MTLMTLVDRIIIKQNHKYFNEIDHICFLSKNLYNSTLYRIRQHYAEKKEYLNYNSVNKIFTDEKQVDYCALPRKVSKCTQMLVDKNYKSFFSLLNRKSKLLYDKSIKVPKYLDKVNGRQVALYCKQALSFKKKGYVKLSGSNILVKTNKDVQFVRLVPKNGYYVIEVGYTIIEKRQKQDNRSYASIDIGVNNLATLTSNKFGPIIINGKPLKSINQYYNKRVASLRSMCDRINRSKTSKRIKSTTLKRENKISDYMHKASRYIVNHLVSTNVNTLICGYNEGWKQDTIMHKNDKQTFIQIPFTKFINMLRYKCQLEGINFVVQEESYTSKASFMDQDYIPEYGKDPQTHEFSGKRIKRGLYKNPDGTTINADVNGSLNIMRKYLTQKEAWNEDIFSNCVEVCSIPIVKSF